MAETQDDYSLFTTSLVVVSAVFPLLATVSLALRFYARRFTSQPLLIDDWMTLVSLVLCWATSINLWVFSALVGVNTIKTDLLTATTLIFKFFYVNNIPFYLVLGIVKIAVLLFYKRIFVIRWFQIAVWVMVGVIAAWTIALIFPAIFMNNPISGEWTDFVATQRVNQNEYSLAAGGMSICFDIIVLCMPLLVIRTLQMPMKRKIVVAGIFWLGSVAVIASAVRFALLYQSVFEVTNDPDAYSNLTKAFHFASLEPNVAVIAASLPTLRPLFTFDKTRADSWFASIGTRLRTRLLSRGSNNSSHLPDSDQSELRKQSSSHSQIQDVAGLEMANYGYPAARHAYDG